MTKGFDSRCAVLLGLMMSAITAVAADLQERLELAARRQSGTARHDYTRQLCESRRWLFERMTETACTAFADAFAVCGIGDGSESQHPDG